jgi:hypothetical protein
MSYIVFRTERHSAAPAQILAADIEIKNVKNLHEVLYSKSKYVYILRRFSFYFKGKFQEKLTNHSK